MIEGRQKKLQSYIVTFVGSQFVLLRRYPAIVHAELAKSALEAYNIPAVISGGVLNRQRTELGIELMVRTEDIEAAREILGPEETFSS